jgi:hypothetical protein
MRIVVFTILALHVVLLGGLLMQGCKPEAKKEAKENELATNGLPLMAPYEPNTNLPAETPIPTLAQNTNVPVTPTPVDTLAPITPAPAGPTTEYTVRKNDSLSRSLKRKGRQKRSRPIGCGPAETQSRPKDSSSRARTLVRPSLRTPAPPRLTSRQQPQPGKQRFGWRCRTTAPPPKLSAANNLGPPGLTLAKS